MIPLLLRAYPRQWRDRYGSEVVDLIDETGMTPRVAIDVVRAGLVERGRAFRLKSMEGRTMTLGPAWRHPTAWAVAAIVVVMPTLLFVVMSLLTYQLGVTGLQPVADPVNAWLNSQRIVDLMLVVAPGIAVVMAAIPLVRIGQARIDGSREASVGVRLLVANVIVVVVSLAVGALLVGHFVAESVLRAGS